MKIVIAMDSFKGSLSGPRACSIIADTISKLCSDFEIVIKPMADGGEGTADVMIQAAGGEWIKKTVTGPLADMQVEAGFGLLDESKTAVVEMAAASGLGLLSDRERNPGKTSTYGTGQLIAAAAEYGVQRILLAVGGSATVDGGTGAAAALGWKFLDSRANEITPCGGELIRIERIIPPEAGLSATVEVLCDVDNPLLGANEAAMIYGPQKGANLKMVALLEAGMTNLAGVIKRDLGKDVSEIPGAGAAGGLAAGAIAFMDASLVSGINTVAKQAHLAEAVADADWIITGEGRFDNQSLYGKVVSGVVAAAVGSRAKIAVIAGQVSLRPQQYRKAGITDAIGCMDEGMDLSQAIENAEPLLAKAVKSWLLSRKIPKKTN